MNQKVCGRVLLGIGAIMMAAAASAQAQTTPLGSYRDATTPPLTCEEGTFVAGMNDKLVPWNQRYTTNVFVNEGVLTVHTYWSWDAYDSRVSVIQPNERWRISVAGVTSEWSDDVEDLTAAGLVIGTMDSFSTPGGYITYEHWSVEGDQSSPNSVQPLGLCVSVARTTTVAPTTATPTTIATTTSSTVPTTEVPTTQIPYPTVPETTTPMTTPTTEATSTLPVTTVVSTVVPTTVVPSTEVPTTVQAPTSVTVTNPLVGAPATNPDPTPSLPVAILPQSATSTVRVDIATQVIEKPVTSSVSVPSGRVAVIEATPAPVEATETPLAFTGASSKQMSLSAVLALAMGAGLIVVSKRNEDGEDA